MWKIIGKNKTTSTLKSGWTRILSLILFVNGYLVKSQVLYGVTYPDPIEIKYGLKTSEKL